MPGGVRGRAGCQGSVSVVVRDGKHKLLSRRLRIGRTCRYSGTATFSAKQLPGSGKLKVSLRFGGNKLLAPRSAKTITVRFG